MISQAVLELLENDKDLCRAATNMLIKIADNVINHPDNEKYRKVNLNCESTEKTLLPAVGALEILFLMGFEEETDKLVLPEKAPIDLIVSYSDQLKQLKSENFPERPQSKQKPMKREVLEARIAELIVMEGEMKKELENQFENVLLFERSSLQEAARNAMPYKELCKNAREMESKSKAENNKNIQSYDFQDWILVELMSWFKEEFFTWFDRGFCEACSRPMKPVGYVPPTFEEKGFGGHRVECYECEICRSTIRFPRYFHPGKLLETRKGRCMEFASCFTLMCRSLGLDARYIWDKTDHVWTEVFSLSQNRWIHADPCENKVDTPLMYEHGWKKQLSYIFGFSKDEIVDCVWRYSSDHKGIRSRRNRCREEWLAQTIWSLNQTRQTHFTDEKKKFLEHRAVKEVVEFLQEPKVSKEGEYEGRLSGSLSWRLSRGEISETSSPPHTIVPSEEEIKAKELILKYCPSEDAYTREKTDDSVVCGWKSLVFSSDNIFRKVEKDWQMAYLARKEGLVSGSISWKFEWASQAVKIASALIVFQHKTYENGSVHWEVCNDDICFPGTEKGVLELSKEELADCAFIEVKATLEGGTGDVAWQHAQLFRQKVQDKGFPFFVKLKFL